ncbi:MAG: sugar phosphate nucleotidyltransferase [Gaiellaceae bacterium]|jgi:mannose-1-phosphate guanylyltransferase/phosphomannomutase
MRAIVMAGGEGTRLRPLTSNQPKPMVPVVGKPCMEHILELLHRHGIDEVTITLAFMPQAIRTYFGDGEALGMSIDYSVEEEPLGTAGSVRLAARDSEEPVLVISGDALCDIDIQALLKHHKERGGAATIGLKSVENPLEFGIVVTDADGRVERFLEKPSWGQVFSDTINTGIYVIEPEALRHVPADRAFDFSAELFPLLLEMGRPLYGRLLEGYWQDIGNLDQYRQANFDALDEKVHLKIPGIRLRGDIWIGEGVEIDDLESVEGPAFIGNYSRLAKDASLGAYSVLGASVTLRERARVAHSVLDSATHVGRNTLIEGSVVGRSCDIRSHVRLHEGVAIGDEVTIGAESVIWPGVRVYPYKEVESGAQIHESLIWESRATTRLFGQDGVVGLVNVDLTPEVAVRLAAAAGTALKQGARVVASREAPTACRMIKRAMISGLNSTGVEVADLRVLPSAVNRHLLKSESYELGIHVGCSAADPEVIQIRFFEPPGIQLGERLQKEIEKHFSRLELRRASAEEVGRVGYPARARESYTQDLLDSIDSALVRARNFRLVVDYGYSAASYVLPLLLAPLGIEAVSAHGFVAERASQTQPIAESMNQAKKLVTAARADLGAVFDRAGERLYLIDEQGAEISVEKTLLLFLRLLASNGRHGKVAFPVTVTSQVEKLVKKSGLEVLRTRASLADLTREASNVGVIFAGAVGGGYVFPDFLPAYDAVASLCKLLELLAPASQPVSELVSGLPQSTLIHRRLHCPWSRKGMVMRVLVERMKGRELDLTDGVKIGDERGWVQVIADSDEPVLHIYAEGNDIELSVELETEIRALIESIIGAEASIVAAPASSGD